MQQATTACMPRRIPRRTSCDVALRRTELRELEQVVGEPLQPRGAGADARGAVEDHIVCAFDEQHVLAARVAHEHLRSKPQPCGACRRTGCLGAACAALTG